MTPHVRRLQTWGWKYRAVFSFTMLAIGVIIAIIMVQHEAGRRVDGEARARRSLEGEVASRRADRDALDRAQQDQLNQLAEVNSKQNQIIKALLTIRKNNPDLFAGVDLPSPGKFDTEVNSITHKHSSSVRHSTSSKPKPVKPKPRPSHPRPKPETPGPTPTSPVPVTPTTVAPVVPTVIVIPPPSSPTSPAPVLPVSPVQIICGVTGICLRPLGL